MKLCIHCGCTLHRDVILDEHKTGCPINDMVWERALKGPQIEMGEALAVTMVAFLRCVLRGGHEFVDGKCRCGAVVSGRTLRQIVQELRDQADRERLN